MQEDKPHDVYCYDPKQETQATWVMTWDEYKNHALEILDILYDPPWSDLGNESLTLHNQSDALIDLSLLHLRINERNIWLTGSLSWNEILTLTGNFRFPNKGACVSLLYQDHHFDTLCYGRDIEAKTTTGEKSSVQSWWKMPQAFIVSVLPNPIGSDTDQERVRIEIREEKIDIAALTLHVGDEKRKATREKQWSSYVAQGSFSLPNKVWCVSLVYRDFQWAKFCYINPAEWEEVYKVEGKLVTLHSDAIKALNNVTVKQDDDDCASREWLVITCKANKKPKATSSPQDSFYKAYIGELHNYLYTNRKTLYYHTDLAHYTALYRDVQSQGWTMMKKYTRSDIVSEMDKRQADNYFERVVMGLEKLAERQTTNEIKKL